MLAHLDAVEVPYSRTGSGSFTGTGGADPQQGKREDTGEQYTYIHDPDGNLIELVYHSLGLASSDGEVVELVQDSNNVRWTQIPGYVESEYSGAQQPVR